MTSSSANRTCGASGSRCRQARRGRPAFTLVELLVVMGIILVLIGLIFPSLGAVWKGSVRTRMAVDLQAISTALDAYKQDHGGYPPVHSAGTGAHQLCRALIAPAGNDLTSANRDGYGKPRTAGDAVGLDPNPGFRTRAGGKVYPPYLPPDKFKLVDPANPRNPTPDLYTAVIGDRYGNPILYYPALTSANIHSPGGYVAAYSYGAPGNRPMFNANDNNNKLTAEQLRRLLGDKSPGAGDGGINVPGNPPDETPAYTGPFILWSAGSDEVYGLKDPSRPQSSNNRCDDVANFPRTDY
jgi:prepilin-type N-terminal cleavage/methylation domain-containing protein